MSKHEVYREGFVHVLSEMCSTCVFRPGNLMFLQPGRLRGMVDEAKANQSVIPCHSTIYLQDVRPAVCRGYFDRHVEDVVGLFMAQRLGLIAEDQPPQQQENGK